MGLNFYRVSPALGSLRVSKKGIIEAKWWLVLQTRVPLFGVPTIVRHLIKRALYKRDPNAENYPSGSGFGVSLAERSRADLGAVDPITYDV